MLTRETCASLAALLTSKYFSASRDLLNQAGMLLISTLTSLKHAGAAFAAHRALQQIAEHCLDSSESFIAKLPALWAQRLLDEISETEKVRDSTLRRSTGYALGFLAIMRSEMSAKVEPRTLCTYILSQILTLSLPAKHDLDMFLSKVGLSPTQLESVFSILSAERNTNLGHEVRMRHNCASTCHLSVICLGPLLTILSC